jgi:hypothetical protein
MGYTAFLLHTDPVFSKCEVLPLPELIRFFQLQFMHAYRHDLLPQAFERIWTSNAERREDDEARNLRNNQELAIPFARTNFSQNMPLTLFPKIWNDFENVIKFDPNKNVFSHKLKECMFLQLNLGFNCSRANCPVCP